MFNAPRPTHANYTGFGGSFVDESANPLAASAYDDGLDPWSGNPSPAPPPVGPVVATSLGGYCVPSMYHAAFSAMDPTGSGECSVNAGQRASSLRSHIFTQYRRYALPFRYRTISACE
ncbi:unnamed protein product [Peniophora sp. CBMAI 1063]|nr:unnamed protein product [Peniophora sp. CBMAI 1063]